VSFNLVVSLVGLVGLISAHLSLKSSVCVVCVLSGLSTHTDVPRDATPETRVSRLTRLTIE
jgi:hypothetical protein